jgi:hypothetical protein
MPRRWPLSTLASLPLSELADLLRAQAALGAAQARVLARPRGRLVAHESVRATDDTVDPATRRRADALMLAVRRAAEFGLFRPKCLVQSLALQSLLCREGIAGSLVRIGVRRDDRGFAAHAWVELAGAPLGERRDLLETLRPLTDARVVLP